MRFAQLEALAARTGRGRKREWGRPVSAVRSVGDQVVEEEASRRIAACGVV